MPSWIIDLAHAEQLLADAGTAQLGIDDWNSFLVGSILPDIPVGFMVPNPRKHIRYIYTHCADPVPIPVPREQEFFEAHLACGSASSLERGIWAHIACDALYNQATIDFLDRQKIAAGEPARIGKQGDFMLFGKSLATGKGPIGSDEVMAELDRFADWRPDKDDVRTGIAVAQSFINTHPQPVNPADYQLLDEEFFTATWEKTHRYLLEKLKMTSKTNVV